MIRQRPTNMLKYTIQKDKNGQSMLAVRGRRLSNSFDVVSSMYFLPF